MRRRGGPRGSCVGLHHGTPPWDYNISMNPMYALNSEYIIINSISSNEIFDFAHKISINIYDEVNAVHEIC